MTRGSVVMVHGAGGGAWEWQVWRRVFMAHGWTVATPELGAAPAGIAATRLADYARQVESACGAPGATPAVLIGASLGGLLAARVAAHVAPRALVLVNPLPPAPWHADLPPRVPYAAVVPWQRDASVAGTRRAMPDADEGTAEFAWRRWRDESGAALNEARSGMAVARPDCAVLFVAGEQDEDVPPALTAAWAQAWQASLLRLPRSSHVGPLLGRAAARCAGLAAQWLDTVAG